jgi:hypothetical protein
MNTLPVVIALVGFQSGQPKPDPVPIGFGIPADNKSYWPVHVLTRSAVQDELKFTDDQKKQAAKLQDDMDEQITTAAGTLRPAAIPRAFADIARKTDTAIDKLLAAEQKSRFRQVTWQVMEHVSGPTGIVTNPVFAKELGLTAEQRKAVAKIAKDHEAAANALFRQAPPGGNFRPAGLDKLQEKFDAQLMKALTDAHKKKWNEIVGEPFKGKIDMPGSFLPEFAPPVPKK